VGERTLRYKNDGQGGLQMTSKQWLAGTIGGGVVLFVVGYILFDTLLKGFYESNAGSATGVSRDPQVLWAVAVGALAYAALIVFALKGQAGSVNVSSGMKAGAIVGFLVWLCADFTFYGITNVNNLTLTIVDPLVELVRGGITGAAIGALLPRLA
jgi:uncharacterized membrane protein